MSTLFVRIEDHNGHFSDSYYVVPEDFSGHKKEIKPFEKILLRGRKGKPDQWLWAKPCGKPHVTPVGACSIEITKDHSESPVWRTLTMEEYLKDTDIVGSRVFRFLNENGERV